jgi:hypothetical protein
MNTKRTNN